MIFYRYLIIAFVCGASFAKAAQNGTGQAGAERQFAAEIESKRRADKGAKQKSKPAYKKCAGVKGKMLLGYKPIETGLGAVERSETISNPTVRSTFIADLQTSFLATMPEEYRDPIIEALKAEGYSEQQIVQVLGISNANADKIDVSEIIEHEKTNSINEEILLEENLAINKQ